MTTKELRTKSRLELEMLLKGSREKIRQLNFDMASKKVKNTNELKGTKKEIARIITILKS